MPVVMDDRFWYDLTLWIQNTWMGSWGRDGDAVVRCQARLGRGKR